MNYLPYQSPIGTLFIAADDQNLRCILFRREWLSFKKNRESLTEESSPILKETLRQLDAYFGKKRKDFDLPYTLEGTDFQIKVWTALGRVPFGKTVTYADQARAVKNPKAVRAVGAANGLNPLCIVLPCHRVIGSSGKLTGYAGGLAAKEFLLKLEGAIL